MLASQGLISFPYSWRRSSMLPLKESHLSNQKTNLRCHHLLSYCFENSAHNQALGNIILPSPSTFVMYHCHLYLVVKKKKKNSHHPLRIKASTHSETLYHSLPPTSNLSLPSAPVNHCCVFSFWETESHLVQAGLNFAV